MTDLLLPVACGISFAAGRYLSRLRGAGVALAVFIALALSGDAAMPFVFATAAPWLVGRALRSRRVLLDSLERRRAEVEAEQEALAELARRRERARIARELHDIVAHHLAAIVVQAGAGRMAEDSDTEAAERLAGIREAGRRALDEMERLVDLLAPDERAPEARDIRVLIDQAQASGMALSASGIPPATELPDELGRLAFQVVREGLTNALKHAPGADVALSLSSTPQTLDIELRNAGANHNSDLAGTGSGLGLRGLRERVEAHGGLLEAGPSEGGWRLHAGLPLA